MTIYEKWVKETEAKDLTNNQRRFAELLLSDPDTVASFGNLEYVFASVRKFCRENDLNQASSR